MNDVAGALELEQVRARGMIIEVEHPEYGTIREVANPIKMAGEIKHPSPAPKLGEHTDDVLRGLLGYSDAKVEELRSTGAIG